MERVIKFVELVKRCYEEWLNSDGPMDDMFDSWFVGYKAGKRAAGEYTLHEFDAIIDMIREYEAEKALKKGG